MKPIDYIHTANTLEDLAGNINKPFSMALTTNFTDEVLARILKGVCLHNGVRPDIYKTPYKQYAFELKNRNSGLWQKPHNISFFFFDINFYVGSEFRESLEYGLEIVSEIESYASKTEGVVVVNSFLLPYHGPLAGRVSDQALFGQIQKLNGTLERLAEEHANVYLFDTNRLAHLVGDSNLRDLRGLYAFDTPFSNDFLARVAEEWFAYIGALNGKTKKVIVLDLDNTLWGGVAGEAGPAGIVLGPTYPGSAYQDFQRALLHYHEAGVLLAINSKNNEADVWEIFEQNPNMVLRREHFAATRINWENKVKNMLELEQELNLGHESFIFFDDEQLNRELIKSELPGVLVPDFSVPPEEYQGRLYSINSFSPYSRTEEDKNRSKQYAEEKERRNLRDTASGLKEFIAQLGIVLDICLNVPDHIPRVSQLTLKTNQFNATTRRYSEKDIQNFMEKGFVYDATIKDKFGNYGLTAVAVVLPESSKRFFLDTFLMSCRVLGRGVEFRFLDAIIRELCERYGTRTIGAEFVPTAKNIPASNFFKEFGFKELSEQDQAVQRFEMDCEAYLKNVNPVTSPLITINMET
jgi:FkbH-like protein